jgi:hypothetical protein
LSSILFTSNLSDRANRPHFELGNARQLKQKKPKPVVTESKPQKSAPEDVVMDGDAQVIADDDDDVEIL